MTHTQKVNKIIQEVVLNGSSIPEYQAHDQVYMLDWITDNTGNLKAIHKRFQVETTTKMDFMKFCIFMWENCRARYMEERKRSKTLKN